jgi:hypothetical protein
MRMLVSALSPERIAQIECWMLPGEASQVGFLASGERLAEIIKRDEMTCADRGIRPEQIADRLETLVGRAKRQVLLAMRHGPLNGMIEGFLSGKGEGVTIEGFRILGNHSRGLQEGPFEDDHGARCELCIYACADHWIVNMRTEREIHFPGLLIHLARDHHFFEGSVKYRLDPAAAIDVLALERNVDYAPTYRSETYWTPVMATSEPYEKVRRDSVIDVSIDDARETIEVVPGIRIFLKDARCVMIAECEHLLDEPLIVGGTRWSDEWIRPGTYVYARGVDTYVV